VLGAATLVVLLGAGGSLGPAAVTAARLEASISPAFNRLTRLQQSELGRAIPAGAGLPLRTVCHRRSGKSTGPGDDWICTIMVVSARPGADPFQLTPVSYDVSVKSNGCYRADAPPSFVGQQTMSDAHGHGVVNPLFTIYGCFDTTAAARSPGGGGAAGQRVAPGAGEQPPATVKREREALREAERAAGPTVLREIKEAEKNQQQATEHPLEEVPEEPERGLPAK